MVIGSPQTFAENPEFLRALGRLIPEQRLAAFANGSGVELRTLPEGCIAGFDYGTVYFARVGKNTTRVRERFETRLVSEPVVRSPHSGVWRVTGMVARTPESLLTVDNDFAAVSVGDPLLVRIAEGFVLERFRKAVPALKGAALATLPLELQSAPLQLYAPGPFPELWTRGAQGLLAQTFAIGIAVSLSKPARLDVHAVMSGAFGPNVEDSRARLLKTWDAIQTSAVGHVLGLDKTTEPSKLEVQVSQATLDFSLVAEPLMKGLSAALSADAAGIFDL
jgi:hypothetical protein